MGIGRRRQAGRSDLRRLAVDSPAFSRSHARIKVCSVLFVRMKVEQGQQDDSDLIPGNGSDE